MFRQSRTRAAAARPDDFVLRLAGVVKTYGRGPTAVTALAGIDIDIPRRSFTAIMGPSGSGKSTALQCAAGLDSPDRGSIRVGDTELSTMSEPARTVWRRDRIGFVFQDFNLIPALTVTKNITLPLRLAGRRPDRAWLAEVIARVGLRTRVDHLPAQLSGGQRQRVAIARALVTRPDVVFGDEPTGALDTVTAEQILTLLRAAVDEVGQTVVMVTHDPVAASFADRVLVLADGRIVDELRQPTVEVISERMTRLGAWA